MPTARSAPNWVNRAIWTGDNLDIMRGMNGGAVDLIYLDPPFNSNMDRGKHPARIQGYSISPR